MVSISRNYSGRTQDLLIFQFAEGRLDGPAELSFGSPVKIITGVEKLKQVFAVVFFTTQGSVLFEERRGTVAGEAIGQSNVSPDLAQHIANIAVVETVNVITADQLDSLVTILPDEILADASVLDVQQAEDNPSVLRVRIGIITAAGQITEIYLPLATSVQV